MGVSFQNRIVLVFDSESDATSWTQEYGTQRLPASHYYGDTPVYGLNQKGNVVEFDSGGYGTFDLSEILNSNVGVVSCVETLQCEEIYYVTSSQVEEFDTLFDPYDTYNHMNVKSPEYFETDEECEAEQCRVENELNTLFDSMVAKMIATT